LRGNGRRSIFNQPMEMQNSQIKVTKLFMACVSALFCAGCGGDATVDPPDGAIFTVRVCVGSLDHPAGETFRVLMRAPGLISEADTRIGQGEGRIISGVVVKGDGGFNSPWTWHLDPATLEFADNTVEVCDGCPTLMQADLDNYIDTVGRYCPWSTEIIERIE
jgi:hypothetical protein